jgi:glycosyltransferase involved in cell wall biosynthesis
MLEAASIICFSQDWEGDPTSKKHIMRILATRNRVLWVNSIGMRRPTASGRDLRRLFFKLRRALTGCVEVEPNLFVINPLVLPLPGVGIAERLNAAVLSVQLRRLCRRLGMTRPILWTFLPYVNRLVGRLGERMVIYHCVDDYAEFTGVPREALRLMEEDVARRAQIVFTSSEQLCSERRALNPNTHFISHGVDVTHFSKALDPATSVPQDMRGLPRPVIGFFGLVADWVDLNLVAEAARLRPDWRFVLVGRTVVDTKVVKGLPNVCLLGQRPYESLPAYCRAFDVGVIPFRINTLTVRANPLKLREYLAAGLPVVATPLPEVVRYNGLIRTASEPGEFVRQVGQALSERGAPFVEARLTAMRRESWESRVSQICGHIDEASAISGSRA